MRATPPKQDGGLYLSDDVEGQLREAQGEPCRSCRYFVIRHSAFVDGVIRGCDAAAGNEVLGRMLMRLAESGRCDEAQPFECLAQPLTDSVKPAPEPEDVLGGASLNPVIEQFVASRL